MAEQVVTILAGNPGAGKSTLLNSMAGTVLFQSGISFGAGLTTVVQCDVGTDGKLYGDTPGLDDIAMRATAAAEINKILREHGAIKLCFVVVLDDGRVRPADVATMTVILDALPPSNNMYSIIINKLEPRAIQTLQQKPEIMQRIMLSLAAGNHSTINVFLVGRQDGAAGEDNVMLTCGAHLRGLANRMPVFRYDIGEVRDIRHDVFEAMQEEFSEKLEAIKKANQAQIDQLTAQHDQTMAAARLEAEKSRDEFVRRMDKMNDDHQRQLSVLNERIEAANRGSFLKDLARAALHVGTLVLSQSLRK